MAETLEESAILWYNFNMKSKKINQKYYNTIQLKFPVDLEKIIEISDPIYTFNEIMEQIDLQKYFVEKGNKIGAICLENGIKTLVLQKKRTPSYHGTGDIFTAVVTSYLLKGESVKKTLKVATKFICDCIEQTKKDPAHSYGVKYEELLKNLK